MLLRFLDYYDQGHNEIRARGFFVLHQPSLLWIFQEQYSLMMWNYFRFLKDSCVTTLRERLPQLKCRSSERNSVPCGRVTALGQRVSQQSGAKECHKITLTTTNLTREIYLEIHRTVPTSTQVRSSSKLRTRQACTWILRLVAFQGRDFQGGDWWNFKPRNW